MGSGRQPGYREVVREEGYPTASASPTTVADVTTAPGLAPIARLSDPELRAQRAAELLDRLTAEHEARAEAVIEVRDAAVRELLARGWSAAQVGRLIGRTRALVAKRFPAETGARKKKEPRLRKVPVGAASPAKKEPAAVG